MKALRSTLATVLMLFAAAWGLAAPADEPPSIEVDLPEQALKESLRLLAEQAGIEIAYRGELVGTRIAPALRGTFKVTEALSRLLEGTGLTFSMVDASHSVIVPAAGSFEKVTVLGTRRRDVPLANVPASITVVDPQAIQDERAISSRIEDIIATEVPGFNPTNEGVRVIRGRTAQVFVNGVPVNEQLRASSGSDLNLITADQLAGIEVSRGANSAYGFGSPGGIIALTTPRAGSETLTNRTMVRDGFNTSRSSESHQTSVYHSVSRIVGGFDFHVGGTAAYDGLEYDRDGNPALGFNNAALLTNSKERLGGLDTSLGFALNDDSRLRFTGTFNHVDFTERYNLTPGVYRQTYGGLELQQSGDQSFRRAHTTNLAYEHDRFLGGALKLEALWSNAYTEVIQDFGELVRDEQTDRYYGIRSSVSRPLGRGGRNITYGVDALRNRYFRPVYSLATGDLFTVFSPDVSLDSFAGYAQVDLPIGENLQLTGGVRHEEYRGHVEDGEGPDGVVGGDIQPFDLTLVNAGLTYRAGKHVDLFGTYSQGSEISQLGRAARDAAAADQVDPQPAKSNQFEVGMRASWGAFRLAGAAFYTQSDLLSALECDGINPCTPLREPREIWGFELRTDWTFAKKWSLANVLTWQEGTREVGGETRRIGSREVPPLLLTGNLTYRPRDWWRTTLQVNYRARRDHFDGSTEFGEGPVDSLTLVNLLVAFDAGPGSLHIGVDNLLDSDYASIAAEASNSDYLWLPEEGRRVTLSYSLGW